MIPRFSSFPFRRVASLGLLVAGLLPVLDAEPRKIVVDPADPKARRTLAEAVPELRPGDTLWLAPGSGPYREVLFIQNSGTAEAPITVEGNGNEVTGFNVIVFETLPDGRHEANLGKNYPFVLRHEGRRVMQTAPAGKFPPGIAFDETTGRLTLDAGIAIESWEISTRSFAVRIAGVSHHRYRNLVASGSRNDGFNLHGEGADIVFENIVGRQNLDEGFSSHDGIESAVIGGDFFENDNGLFNGQKTRTRLERVDLRNNLGFGLGFGGEAVVSARSLRCWGNGMMQILLREGVRVDWKDVEIYRNTYASRPLMSFAESARWQSPKTLDVPTSLRWADEAPRIFDEISPAERAGPTR